MTGNRVIALHGHFTTTGTGTSTGTRTSTVVDAVARNIGTAVATTTTTSSTATSTTTLHNTKHFRALRPLGSGDERLQAHHCRRPPSVHRRRPWRRRPSAGQEHN